MHSWIKALINGYVLNGKLHSKDADFYKNQKENIILKSEDSQYFGSYVIDNDIITDQNTKYFVVVHGVGADREETLNNVKFRSFENFNSIFLLVDVRGFGESADNFSREGVNKDLDAAFRCLKTKFNATQIFIVGHSFGAAFALAYAEYAKKNTKSIQPAKIFLFSPFKSFKRVLHERGVALDFFLNIEFQALKTFYFKIWNMKINQQLRIYKTKW